LKLEFSPQIIEKCSDIKFLEIRLVGAKLFYRDRRTDTTKVMVAFRNFVKSPRLLLPNHRVYFCVMYGSQKNRGVSLT